MVQLAVGMDQEVPENPLLGEEWYFHGSHLPCSGYKTLTLSVYDPAMWHILRLAAREVKSESTHEISLFWNMFYEVLSQITERDYKFNSKAIMADENGVNSCAIK